MVGQLLALMRKQHRSRLEERSAPSHFSATRPPGPELNPEVFSILAWSLAELYVHCRESRGDMRELINNSRLFAEWLLERACPFQCGVDPHNSWFKTESRYLFIMGIQINVEGVGRSAGADQ